MKKIGIISDTHGNVHGRVFEFLNNVDELWHAGDIGPGVAEQCKAFKPFRAVYGNIDGKDVRLEFPASEVFQIEGVKVLMLHIGGYPGRYDPRARRQIIEAKPALLVCGHSHILRVMYDKLFTMLVINPGAAGLYGFHKSITAVRFEIDGSDMRNLEVLDVPRLP